ncbi:predicted protein [Uncinocarpus reesii 1704]|uniref:Uncharacterized protein n=1 Tax=Uncinocarpus reesii (strain UAMH 1704) TaxID=336963 RepID=C4JQA0_UNCRE|nr:uncharacterized protein UREG_04654 [Uncinocarpus reesii 1704]EEP79808.1 predicted protein [Uncinocarpus reesii 1704]
MATQEPWLEGLTDDWIANSRLSTFSHALSASPRLPKRPKSSINTTSQHPPAEPKPSRLNNKRSQSPASQAPSYLKTPTSPFSSPASQCTKSTRNRSSSRASLSQVSKRASNTPMESTSTMNIRLDKSNQHGNTPEWKRRLLRGDAPSSESVDLFGPIGLQKLFTPPSGSHPAAQIEQHARNSLSLRSRLSGNSQRYKVGTLSTDGGSQKLKLLRSWDKENINLTLMEQMSEVSPADLSRLLRESQISIDDMDMGWLKQDFSRLTLSSAGNSLDGPRDRSASGIEETRNEAISPIPLPTPVAFKDGHSLYFRRPASSASDSLCEPHADQIGEYPDVDDSIEITSHSLPEGLSMGTHEFASAAGFANVRRGGYQEDNTSRNRWLNPSLTPSQLPSSAGARRIRNHSPNGGRQESCQLAPRRAAPPFTPKKQISPQYENSQPSDMKSSGSPLKLFGNHDTFTNNKLLRRMSQFEETFEATLEEGPSCALESAEISEDDTNFENEQFRESQLDISHCHSVQSQHGSHLTRNEEAAFRSSKHADKRVLNSPTKDSAPKRRRTLVAATQPSKAWHEPIIESAEFSSVLVSPQQPDESFRATRPRNEVQPERSSNSVLSQQRSINVKSSLHPSPSKLAADRSHEPYPKIIKHVPATNAARRGSITTQDFLDEATKIMNHIRTRGGPKNGLPGLEEYVAKTEESPGDAFSEASTQEQLSRPPSREVGDLPAQRNPNEPDPRIISHLKRFEDSDELDVFMGASVMSLRLKSRQRGPKPLGPHAETAIESSPANVRIHEGVHSFHPEQRGTGQESTFSSYDLGISKEELRTATSTESIPTGSTGSARAKGIISSRMISHLIPERVGAMTYDRAHHMWVKGRPNHDQNLASLLSEDDPFRDIPDLSVDELRELIAIRNAPRCQGKAEGLELGNKSVSATDQGQPKQSPSDGNSRPQTRDNASGIPLDTSSVQSKSTQFTSSEPQPDTRATSWATTDLTSQSALLATQLKSDISQHTREAEHESRLHDGYPSPIPSPINGDRKQARSVTITLPSPLASPIDHENENKLGGKHQTKDLAESSPNYLQPRSSESIESIKRRRAALGLNLVQDSLPAGLRTGRSVSRIDECDENIFNELSGLGQELSVLPAGDELSLLAPQDSPLDTSYSFHLSPLADFTVNQIDESMRLELSYVAERTYSKSLRQVHGTFALAAEELVRHITDVEPYEAYWQYLRRLTLRDKRLITLLQLNKYCSRLQELDASKNRIGQLGGAPTSLRSLNISHNCLSNLTAWGHLANLQYLDVSNNELENLDSLSGLVHLRSLKVNNNKLSCINGIFNLDGLLTFKARNNRLASIDFRRAELFRLANLDLSGNKITNVEGIDSLTALEALDLRYNELKTFTALERLQHLQSLKLSHNHLQSLDVSISPALRLLYVDCNHLSTIVGLEACQCLDTLSMREQNSSSEDYGDRLYPPMVDLDLSINASLRKVFLSCNSLSPDLLAPPCTVPTLQLLDLASCGLESLPQTFGKTFPNLNSLNLNFNALSDVGSLDGIFRLSRLFLVGNRISRLRRLCQVLRDVGGKKGSIARVDLRGNPLTLGFYPSPICGNGRLVRGANDIYHHERKAHQLVKSRNTEHGEDDDNALAPLGGCADIARAEVGEHVSLVRPEAEDVEIEIDDPYTVPLANSAADERYLVHLNEETRLRRRVVELMIHAATSSRLKVLDGLDLSHDGSEFVSLKKDWVWRRLVELGGLKKRM